MFLDERTTAVILDEMTALRDRVSGVLGCVLAGVDGLLLVNDAGPTIEPHDIAAMAAATVGIGRQLSMALHQGPFQECLVRNGNGYFAVYGAGEYAVLAVRADNGLNVARLHLEARSLAPRLADALHGYPVTQADHFFASS